MRDGSGDREHMEMVSKVAWSVCMHGAMHLDRQFKLNSLRQM